MYLTEQPMQFIHIGWRVGIHAIDDVGEEGQSSRED